MIQLKDVVLRFGERTILNHVNLEIADGETMVILGGSGAGKSTILRLIIGLLKPTSGEIIVNGQDISKMTEDELASVRKNMGMVFQYSALFDSMSVGDNVAFGLRMHTEMDETAIQKIVADRLNLVGLPNVEGLMPNELSGGMKKRVGLARAIAQNPQVILYDEPTSGLDPISSTTISELICAMKEHLKCTSIVVTHDMQSAFAISDRIALLDNGNFIEVARPDQFRESANPKVQEFIYGIDKMGNSLRREKTDEMDTRA